MELLLPAEKLSDQAFRCDIIKHLLYPDGLDTLIQKVDPTSLKFVDTINEIWVNLDNYDDGYEHDPDVDKGSSKSQIQYSYGLDLFLQSMAKFVNDYAQTIETKVRDSTGLKSDELDSQSLQKVIYKLLFMVSYYKYLCYKYLEETFEAVIQA